MTVVALPDLGRLETLADVPPGLALERATPLLAELAADRSVLDALVAPVVQRLEASASGGGPYVAQRYDSPASACSLQVFVWPPGARTQIHDHSCWGAFCCLVGAVSEDRYRRLDDGRRPNYAHLKKVWRRFWRAGGGISTLLPYDGGIHRVGNPTDRPAISLHLYGPPGQIDGRDYDPLHDYVCDRLE